MISSLKEDLTSRVQRLDEKIEAKPGKERVIIKTETKVLGKAAEQKMRQLICRLERMDEEVGRRQSQLESEDEKRRQEQVRGIEKSLAEKVERVDLASR